MKTSEKELKKRALYIVRSLARMYPRARVFLNHSNALELLIAVILSAQCTDRKVNEVTKNLFKKYKTINDYVRAGKTKKGIAVFEKDIMPTGFFRVKTKHILRSAEIIQKKFNGEIPKTMNELVSLPGVGRKTANIVLESAFGVVDGIPVDTHVFRLAHIFGLSHAKTPEGVEKDLCFLIPKKYWGNLSYRMISYGREYCPARSHDHKKCPLSKIGV